MNTVYLVKMMKRPLKDCPLRTVHSAFSSESAAIDQSNLRNELHGDEFKYYTVRLHNAPIHKFPGDKYPQVYIEESKTWVEVI